MGLNNFVEWNAAKCAHFRAQRNHIGLALRAFLRLECHCLATGISWFHAKTGMIRQAVRTYLANPLYTLLSTA